MKSEVSAVLLMCLAASPLAAQPRIDSDSDWRRGVALASGKEATVTDHDGRVRTGYQPCGSSCHDEISLMWTGLIGFPVLGGYGAYRATRHEVERFVYVMP